MAGAGAPAPTGASQFVGRHAEAALVGLALDQTHDGPTALIIRGEPGIGKTRLLGEAIARARLKGQRVLWVRANAHEARVPFGALSVALEQAASDDATFAAAASAMRSYIGAAGGREGSRLSFAQICDTSARMLIDLGEQAPTSLVVDDLHVLDYESLALLGVVLGRVAGRNVSFICTTRSGSADLDAHAAELLARLAEWPDVEELNLGPLAEGHVQTVLEGVFGKPVSSTVAEVVARRSGGNPLFVLEMARSLAELDFLDTGSVGIAFQSGDGPTDLHLTRHTAILQRLFPLSAECRRVAQIVAVLHRIRLTDLDIVADLSGLDGAAVAGAFDELERRGIVTADGAGTWSLFHPFVADALYDDIGRAERRRMHRLIADHLDARRKLGDAVDLMRLAWHIAESADVGDLNAAGLLADAAESIKGSAPVSAADLCRKALSLLPPDSGMRTALLSLRTRCLILAGRPADAVTSGLEALQDMPVGAERTRVANAVIGSMFDVGRVDDARALADREAADGTSSAFLLSQRAMLIAAQGDAAAARRATEEALAVPTRSAGEDVLVRSFVSSAATLTGPMTEAVRQLDLLRDAALATRSGMTAYGLSRRCWTLVVCGFVRLGQEAVDEAEASLGDIGPGTYSDGVTAARFGISWMKGEWDHTLAAIGDARRDVHISTVIQRYMQSVEIEVRSARGQLREALALVNQPIAGGSATMSVWATSGALIATGDDAGARSLLRAAIDRPTDASWVPHLLCRLLELEHRTGELRAAKEALAELEHATDGDPRQWVAAMVLRGRAVVQQDAACALQSAEVAAAEGLVYDAALARLVAAALDPADTEVLLTAHDALGALGAEAERRRAASLLRQRGAKVPRRRRRTEGQLTSAEAQIARLVQAGMRNREIAHAANYSERTVEVYLSRIYTKLGVSSRLQLARLLDEQGLPEHDAE